MNDAILHLGLLSDEEIQLDVAALALSALDHEGADITGEIDVLRKIGIRLADLAEGLSGGEEQAALLAQVFHSEFGFNGDQDSYDAPLNGDMIRVIDRRLGLPVSLSILYVAAARRLGWSADALNTPGHVLVSVGPKGQRTIIDPFNGGAELLPHQMMTLLGRAHGSAAWPSATQIEAMSNRGILIRLILNQAMRAEHDHDLDRAAILYERMTTIAPSHGQGWWDLARLQLIDGKVDHARASLSAMLEVTCDQNRRMNITDALSRLSSM